MAPEKEPPIVFKTEDSLWQMMADVGVDGLSAKPFDMRLWSLEDDRIYRLAWGCIVNDETGERGQWVGLQEPLLPAFERVLKKQGRHWEPDEKEVSFLNKVTGEVLTFEYRGVEFAPWAPGWGFLILGKLLNRTANNP